MEIVSEAKKRKLGFPLTVRFHDLLRDRVETINKAFADAIETMGYRQCLPGRLSNQGQPVARSRGRNPRCRKALALRLEAGSKPELMAALAFHDDPESLIICNGYKDTAFVRTALLGRKLGKTVILVVEKLEELMHILKVVRTDADRAVYRPSRAPAFQGSRQMGDQRRRKREIWSLHRRACRGKRSPHAGRASPMPSSWFTST